MKTNLKVEDFEDKKTTAGKRYTRFKTDKGFMSCFDTKVSEELKKYEGKIASVEVKTSGKYSNIEKVYGNEEPTEDEEQVEIQKFTKNTQNTERIDRAKALEIANGDIDKAKEFYNYITNG